MLSMDKKDNVQNIILSWGAQALKSFYEEACLYWEEVEKMGYSFNMNDIKTSKNNRRFNKMQELLINADIISIYENDFKIQRKEETIKEVNDLYNEIFKGKYNDKIKTFETKVIEQKQDYFFGGTTCFDIDYEKNIKQIKNIKVNSLEYLYSPIVLSHEYMHCLFEHKEWNPGFNINYNEILPILIEKITATKLDDKLGTNILFNVQAIRMNALQNNANGYRDIIPCASALDKPINKLTKPELTLKYCLYTMYAYLVSSIYAEQLFDYYLDDPKIITTRIENLIERKETFKEILDDFNISLGDNNTFNTFQKSLNKVSRLK